MWFENGVKNTQWLLTRLPVGQNTALVHVMWIETGLQFFDQSLHVCTACSYIALYEPRSSCLLAALPCPFRPMSIPAPMTSGRVCIFCWKITIPAVSICAHILNVWTCTVSSNIVSTNGMVLCQCDGWLYIYWLKPYQQYPNEFVVHTAPIFLQERRAIRPPLWSDSSSLVWISLYHRCE